MTVDEVQVIVAILGAICDYITEHTEHKPIIDWETLGHEFTVIKIDNDQFVRVRGTELMLCTSYYTYAAYDPSNCTHYDLADPQSFDRLVDDIGRILPR